MQRLTKLFTRAFRALGVQVSLVQLEDMVVTVHNAMSSEGRHYHNLEHVFNFLEPPDPIQYLAAAFHDVIYIQVDGGVLPELQKLLRPYVKPENGIFSIRKPFPLQDRQANLILEVFGYQPGQLVSLEEGLNEFLSTLVMTSKLGGVIKDQDLLQSAVCIEATIPFRGLDPQGCNSFDLLAERLRSISARCGFECGETEINAALHRAVIFSNKDVANFSEPDARRFLDTTWKLLPETNSALRSRAAYTISEYREGIQKMDAFLKELKVENVFNRYQDTPSGAEFQSMVDTARRNVSTAVEYMHLKLVTTAILESLAGVTGGDAPMTLFMGDLPRPSKRSHRLEDYLPALPNGSCSNRASQITQIFEEGRLNEVDFDTRNAHLTLFVCQSLSTEQIDQLYSGAQKLFAGRMTYKGFLAMLPAGLLSNIAQACAEMVYTRREKLLNLIKN